MQGGEGEYIRMLLKPRGLTGDSKPIVLCEPCWTSKGQTGRREGGQDTWRTVPVNLPLVDCQRLTSKRPKSTTRSLQLYSVEKESYS